jgi:hypothetical protein
VSCDGVVAGAGSEIQETNVASEGKLGVDCFSSVSNVGIADGKPLGQTGFC